MGKVSEINDDLDPRRRQGLGSMVLRSEGSVGLRFGGGGRLSMSPCRFFSLHLLKTDQEP